MSFIWKAKSGAKIPMREMSEKELQSALEVAERRHVDTENSIQEQLKRSRLFLTKALEIRQVARERNLKLKSLPELYPGKYEFITNTYRLIE